MLHEELLRRRVPPVLTPGLTAADWPARRSEILDVLLREEYGYLPPPPLKMSAKVIRTREDFCAGKALSTQVELTCTLPNGEFTFPVSCVIPNDGEEHPCFVHINFRGFIPDAYMPTEEIIDHGFAMVSCNYNDITQDREDGFASGLGALVYPDGKRAPDACGKIGLWAWGTMRMREYASTLSGVLPDRLIAIGHSRLGKTALLAAAMDEGFFAAVSNDSGCSGAAITREKKGERVENICKTFPYWFCENYQKYRGKEETMPFEQHFLLSCIAPRPLCVGSSEMDEWADPESEYLGCVAASPVYTLLGKAGFTGPDRYPAVGDIFPAGSIAYHLRPGTHYLGRWDWLRYMAYFEGI